MNIQLIINNVDTPAHAKGVFSRTNPMTGNVVTQASAAKAADAVAAADAAAAAFPQWSETGPNARRVLLLKAADALQARAADFVEAMMNETGATAPWAQFNVMLAAGMLREAGSMTTQITRRGHPFRRAGPSRDGRSASRPASSSASRPGTRRSSSASARSPCRWPAATP